MPKRSSFNPDLLRGLIIWSVLSTVAYHAIAYFFSIDQTIHALLSLNLATYAIVAIDKFSAQLNVRRMPEMVFYIATFFGGALGMLLGMYNFRHKTRKTSFQIVIALLILVQIAIVYYGFVR